MRHPLLNDEVDLSSDIKFRPAILRRRSLSMLLINHNSCLIVRVKPQLNGLALQMAISELGRGAGTELPFSILPFRQSFDLSIQLLHELNYPKDNAYLRKTDCGSRLLAVPFESGAKTIHREDLPVYWIRSYIMKNDQDVQDLGIQWTPVILFKHWHL